MKMRGRSSAATVPARCSRRVLAAVVSLMILLARVQSWAVDEPSESVQEITRMWKEQKGEIAGWQDEKTGATWKQVLINQPDGASSLLMPKTIKVVRDVGYWLNLDTVKTDSAENKNDPAVKAIMAEAHQTFDTASAKLNDAFNNVMAEAEKDDAHYRDELAGTRVDDLKLAADGWFEGTAYHDRNVARARKLKEKWETMASQSEAAREALAAKMTADASAAWPAIAGSIKAQDGFTPDKLNEFKGKTIHLKGHNTLGSAFNPGEYDYASEINGMPIAGKFTPAVAEVVDKATKQTGHDLPGEDWDVYAVVEGPGQIARRMHSKGAVKVNGQEVGKFTAEGSESVPCVVVRIFAVHAGPVAAGSSADAGAR